MYRGYKAIDADSHVMEPEGLWEKYIDPQYSRFAPKGGYVHRQAPHIQLKIEVAGHSRALDPPGESPYIPDGHGGLLTYGEAYREFIADGFSPKSYQRYLEWRGLDYIVLYPSVGMITTVNPGLDPKAAAAIWRAYNNWLYDFCQEGGDRLIGVPMLDLRDVDLAITEARRCVGEMGFKTVALKPETPLPGIPLSHSYYDPLWSAIEELGVPIGIHEGGSIMAEVVNSGIQGANSAVQFYLGAQLATLFFCGTGGICERHPRLRIIFTESSTGWIPGWLWYLDEQWERGTPYWSGDSERRPSEYFKAQCFVSAEPEESGLTYVVDYLRGADNIVYNTDWPHPREAKVSNPADEFLALDGISDTDKRKILWDNAAKLYQLS